MGILGGPGGRGTLLFFRNMMTTERPVIHNRRTAGAVREKDCHIVMPVRVEGTGRLGI